MEPTFQVLPPDRQPPPPKKSFFESLGAGAVAIGVAFLKFKYLLFASFKTGFSMLIMIWFYSWRFGWPFAAGLVFLILVHEMGHVCAAKWRGMPVTAPLFIPFIGAFILMKDNPRDAWTEALVAYGGPLFGCIGSWICLFVGLNMQAEWVIGVASVSFILNLFNMIPVPPLDGGRICASVSTWFWLVGLVLLGLSLFYFHSWSSIVIIGLLLFYAVPRIKAAFVDRGTPEMQAYYATHISDRLTMALMYVGLIAALLLGYWDASTHLSYILDQGPTIQ